MDPIEEAEFWFRIIPVFWLISVIYSLVIGSVNVFLVCIFVGNTVYGVRANVVMYRLAGNANITPVLVPTEIDQR
jgi:hypothetical protein